MSARKAQAPRSARVEPAASRASARMRGMSVAWIFCPSVSADPAEAHHGRDRRGDLREDEGLKAGFEREAIAGGGGRDRDRIGDALLFGERAQAARSPRRPAPPRRRPSPRGCLRAAVRRSRRARWRGRWSWRARVRLPIPRRENLRRTEWRRRAARRTSRGRPASRRSERVLLDIAVLHRPFEPLRIGK